MIPKLGKVQRIDVRTAWTNEASHFTPWLASEEGMALLQETLDMELEVEATEKSVGPFKADILAKRTDTTDDHWVLIENQLERTDHRHLGQLLTYAAGLDAVTIVWVAESFAEEHRAALNWLNDITDEGLEFFGLEVELWQIEGSPPAPMFNIVAEPNEWSRDVKQAAGAQLSDLKQQQKRYWQELRTSLQVAKSKVRPHKPRPQHWTTISIGRADTWLAAGVNTAKKFVAVEFAFRGPAGKVWFDELLESRAEIESVLGMDLSWQRLEGKKMSRVTLRLENADPTNEADWPRQHEWMAEKLEAFRKTFRPHALAFSDSGGDARELEDEED